MKVCMLTRTYPPRTGGPGSLVYRVSKLLIEKGFEVGVITQKIEGLPKEEVIEGVKVYRAAVPRNELSNFGLAVGSAAFLKKILRVKGSYDIFHAHDISVAGFAGYLAKKTSNKPFILKYGGDLAYEFLSLRQPKGWNPANGLEETFRFNDFKTRLLRKVQKSFFKTYNLILPDSSYGKYFIEKFYSVSPGKIEVVHNGVSVERFSFFGNTFEKFRGPVIFTGGRITAWKGFDVLIKALAAVRKEISSAQLVIAGDGPMLSEYKILSARLGLEKSVHFVGKIHPDEMHKYLASCDVFALASYFDTTPNSLLEAMASGKPCVASDIEGIKEVLIDGCGSRASVGSERDFAEKIIKVLSERKKANILGGAARARIEKFYSLENTASGLEKVYRRFEK